MKRMKKILAILMSVLMAFSVASSAAYAQTADTLDEELVTETAEFYFENGAAETSDFEGVNKEAAYKALRDGLDNLERGIYVTGNGLTRENVADFYYNFVYENPQYFYVYTRLSYSLSTSGDVVRIFPSYITDQKPAVDSTEEEIAASNQKILAMKELFEAETEKLMSNVNDSMTDVEKLLALHDALVCHNTYSAVNVGEFENSIFTSYGAIVEKASVCQGYTLAYIYLLHLAGFNDVYCVYNDIHSWVMVKLDGELYHIDVTVDDPIADVLGRVSHDHFLVTDSKLAEMDETNKTNNHQPWTPEYSATSTKYEGSERFWNNSTSQVIFSDSDCYYVDNLSTARVGKITKLSADGSSEVLDTIDDYWYADENENRYYANNYTRMIKAGDKLYYNDPLNVYSYDLETGEKAVVYTLPDDVGTGYNRIYGLKKGDNMIYVGYGESPTAHNGIVEFECTFDEKEEPWTYTVIEDGIRIDRYNESEADVVVPDTIDGLAVVEIGDAMLKNSAEHTGVQYTSVALPATVKRLSNSAFAGVPSLKTVTLSEGLLTIGADCFSGCTGLTSVVIPSTVTAIESAAFTGCTALKNVTILSRDAELYPSFLGYDSEGNAIEGIELYGYRNTSAQTYAENNEQITFIPLDPPASPWETEELEDGTLKLVNYAGEDQQVEIPSEIDGKPITVIGAEAFADTAVTEVTIPETITAIKSRAFVNTNITEVIIPETVEEIGECALGYNLIDNFYTKVENFKIYANFETAAQAYADLNSIEFVPLNDPKPVINSANHSISYEGIVTVDFDVTSYSDIKELKIFVNDEDTPYLLESGEVFEISVEEGKTYDLKVTAETIYGTVSDVFNYSFTVDVIPEPPYNPWVTEAESDVEGIINTYDELTGELYLKSAEGNGHEPVSNPPALIAVNDEIQLPENGTISFTLNRIDSNDYARFGILIGYGDSDNNLLIGYDAQGWFWQKFGNGSNDWYQGTRTAKPAAGTSVDVVLQWEGTTLVKATADGQDLFDDLPLDFSDIENLGSKVAFMAGTSGGATAEFKIIGFDCQENEVAEPEYALGDVNMDGSVDIKDATLLQQYLASMFEATEVTFNEELADVNGDGRITVTDATYIQLIAAKLLVI